MREHREPWLKLPEKKPGGDGERRLDPRFRTHVVAIQRRAAPPAEPLPQLPSRSPAALSPPQTVLPFRLAEPVPPKPIAIEPAAAEPMLLTQVAATRASSPPPPSAPAAQRGAGPALAAASLHPVEKPAQVRASGAPPLGLDDLPAVSSADWVAKVGAAAKMVDVIVVFYSSACLGSELFELAFQTVVNEVLPELERPYAVYRFSLDAEPAFVSEMAESLGLPEDDPVSIAGFAWSGPGRRLFLIGGRALASRAALSLSLRRNLTPQPAPFAGESDARRRDVESVEGPREQAPRPQARRLAGRVLAILAWCLLGTAALGAAVVGVAPQWAHSLLPSSLALPGRGAAPKDPPRAADAQTSAAPPAAGLDNSIAGSAGTAVNPAKPAHGQVKKKRAASSLSLNPSYWGLPEGQLH
ncbi:MAG TPA: hypothetical protein VN823_24945 [Stellaceae bacterium]|nr:hypothetical protein [Stellaceae bacterium]